MQTPTADLSEVEFPETNVDVCQVASVTLTAPESSILEELVLTKVTAVHALYHGRDPQLNSLVWEYSWCHQASKMAV